MPIGLLAQRGVGEGTKTGCDPRAQGGQHPRGCQLWVLFGGSRDVGTQQRGGTSVLGEHWCTALLHREAGVC